LNNVAFAVSVIFLFEYLLAYLILLTTIWKTMLSF
jgi:hypothetical protein